jgi:transposase-like protein
VTQGELGGAGWSEDGAFGGRLRPFSRDGYVLWSEDGGRAEVFVGSTLIGMFERQDPRARNLILIGLCQGRRVRVGRLARAFGITDETLRKVRRLYEKEGLAGLVGGKSRGRALKLSGAPLQAVHRWFGQGLSVRQVQQKLKERRVPVSVSVGTLGNERARWKTAQRTRTDDGAEVEQEAPPSEPPEGRSQGDAQCALPVQLDRAPTTASAAVPQSSFRLPIKWLGSEGQGTSGGVAR